MVERLMNSEANARRIALVESCFGSAGQPLAVPGRVLIGEGILTKLCRKKPKARQFFLFNDILIYGNIIINKKKYNKQHVIPLEEIKLQALEDDGLFKNGWLICARGKSFAVFAATATEKQEWMAHIDKCIRDLLHKSGKKAANDHAAVWVPDKEAHACMVCKKSHFTVLNRRHHCRKCGSVVCGPCSMRKYLLYSQSSKPLRVCDPCYASLSKQPSRAGRRSPTSKTPGDEASSVGETKAGQCESVSGQGESVSDSSTPKPCRPDAVGGGVSDDDADTEVEDNEIFGDCLEQLPTMKLFDETPQRPVSVGAEDLPEIPGDEPAVKMPDRNPRLYNLVQVSNDCFDDDDGSVPNKPMIFRESSTTRFWWDGKDNDDFSEDEMQSMISCTVHDNKSDSSGEEDSDDDDSTNNASAEAVPTKPNFYANQDVEDGGRKAT